MRQADGSAFVVVPGAMKGDGRIVTLLTDFGTEDGYAAAMKAVILSEAPGCTVIDASHDIPPHDVRAGAWSLGQYWHFYPAGSIHVAVVDPGVGTERQALLARADDHLLVAPDNGLLAWAQTQAVTFEARRITAEFHRPGELSTTFHGRDIFAYAAGLLAGGATSPEEISAVVDEVVRPGWAQAREEEGCLVGEIVHCDHFGNLITNVSRRHLAELGWEKIKVEAGEYIIPGVAEAYADVLPGGKLALFGSAGLLELAVREGSAAAATGLQRGRVVRVRKAG